MEIKTEEEVMDELKSANLIIPPEITITPVPSTTVADFSIRNFNNNRPTSAQCKSIASSTDRSKYTQLLMVIEEIGKDIRPTYTGSKGSTERLKRGIMHARVLVRECLTEVEKNARL